MPTAVGLTASGATLLLASAALAGCSGAGSHPLSQTSASSTATAGAAASLLARRVVVPTTCSVSSVRHVSIALKGNGVGGYAVGSAAVFPLIGDESRPLASYKPRHAPRMVEKAVVPLVASQVPPWLAVKLAWVRPPTYRGPYVVRGARIGGNSPARVGASPSRAPFVVGSGPGLNGGNGYRVDPGYLWVRRPGCYVLQIDGTTFTTRVTLELVPPGTQ